MEPKHCGPTTNVPLGPVLHHLVSRTWGGAFKAISAGKSPPLPSP